eukprot:2317482-Prorocentrum_lima.AAC.1
MQNSGPDDIPASQATEADIEGTSVRRCESRKRPPFIWSEQLRAGVEEVALLDDESGITESETALPESQVIASQLKQRVG